MKVQSNKIINKINNTMKESLAYDFRKITDIKNVVAIKYVVKLKVFFELEFALIKPSQIFFEEYDKLLKKFCSLK